MRILATMSAIALLLSAPAMAQTQTQPAELQTVPPGAVGTFIDVSGAEVGTVTLTPTGDSVAITAELTGMAPGDHGFHFHETGDCDPATAFESAGSHFNPENLRHGLDNPEGAHAGDLPNVTAAEDGTVSVDLQSQRISLDEGAPGYIFDADGTALVFHAEPDDQVTDPSGNSGDRLACAVLEPASPQ
jgi:Cu/Zn superoxide dismutase